MSDTYAAILLFTDSDDMNQFSVALKQRVSAMPITVIPHLRIDAGRKETKRNVGSII